MTFRGRFGWWLRKWADRIDHYGAPKFMSYSFTFEAHEGIRFRDDHRGCPLAYLGDDDWERAYSEADTDWTPTPSREELLAGLAAASGRRNDENP